jgi:hypothetical protein
MAATIAGSKDKTGREILSASGDKIRGAVRKNSSKSPTEITGRWNKSLSRQELRQESVRELSKLRSLLKDVGTNCLDRLDGELAALALSLAGGHFPGDPPVLPSSPTLLAMLADIRALKVKPKRGRVKDVRRIEALLESLHDQMPPEA